VNNIRNMDELFEASFSPLTDAGRSFTRCGLTNRYLHLIEARPPRLYNPSTEEVYKLPQGGGLKQCSGQICVVCQFEICLYVVGGRSYPLCPYCFNHHRDEWGEQVSMHGTCVECPLPDRHPTVEARAVCADPEGGGVFILDPGSATNKWSLISTRSNFMITMPKSVLKVTVLSHVDETGFRPLRIDFRPGESPLSNSEARYTGNIGSDEFMQSLVHYKMDSNSNRVRGGKRGGKGGKGRKGGKQGGKKGGKATPFSDF